MSSYETIFVFDPELSEEQTDGQLDRVKKSIADIGGSVDKVDKWGPRRLAYEINRKRDGLYVQVDFQADAGRVPELDRQYRLNESILRHLTIQATGVHLGALKPPEQGKGYVVRLAELHGGRETVTVQFDRRIANVQECDLLESPERRIRGRARQFALQTRPFQITTVRYHATTSS